jgi:PKD repeat protein
MQRNKTQGRYFIEKFEPSIDKINILPDIRYVEYPEDEVYWLKNETKGLLIFVERKGIYDANDTEKVNNTIIKNLADYTVKWATLDEQSLEHREMINWYAKLILDQYYIPMVYSATTCQ